MITVHEPYISTSLLACIFPVDLPGTTKPALVENLMDNLHLEVSQNVGEPIEASSSGTSTGYNDVVGDGDSGKKAQVQGT